MALNVGLIGCGLNGRFHSTAIRAIARRGMLDINYAAVCDVIPERARAFAEITGAEPFTDPGALTDASGIDAVYVCVPTAWHKELVLRAAAHGKHVFCEKPLATNLADVEEMTAATESAGVKAGVGLVLRHSPIMTVLKELIDDGSLGRQMAIIFRDDQFFPIMGHYASEWRKDRTIAGAGTLLEHSIHDVDVLHWFGGPVKGVRGSTRNFAGYEGVEDLAMAYLDFESGAQANLISIWHSVLGRPSTRRLEVFYEKGFFSVDHDYMGPVHYQTHAQNSGVINEQEVHDRYLARLGLPNDVFERLMRHTLEDYMFLKAVIEGQNPFPDFRTALAAHRVVDAIYRSAEAGGDLVKP
jgi:predicted dehydrogenase